MLDDMFIFQLSIVSNVMIVIMLASVSFSSLLLKEAYAPELNGWNDEDVFIFFSTHAPCPWEILMKFRKSKFQTNFSAWWLRFLSCNSPYMNVTGLYWW